MTDLGNPNATLDRPPMELLADRIDYETLSDFRKSAFRTMQQLERLRDWVDGPEASGARRGLALWVLGRHKDAVPELQKEANNPVVANCLARSLCELGRLDEAEKVLTQAGSDPHQAATMLEILDRRGDPDKLLAALEKNAGVLTPADAAYYRGRAHEQRFEAEAAIAAYDDALRHDPTHTQALFRL
ncbi:MAG TPA: hypothetical protein VK081_04535, partial [Planctomycetota bacterium]|nr:hypothetical protein [Planctomycetota bacterium]